MVLFLLRVFGSVEMNGCDCFNCRTISQDDLQLFDIPEPPNSERSESQQEERKYPPNKCKCKCAVHQPGRQPLEQEKQQTTPRLARQQSQQTELSVVGEKIGVPKGPEAIVVTPASPEDKSYINDLKNTIQKLENVSILKAIGHAYRSRSANRSSHCNFCFAQDLHEVTIDSQKMARVNVALEERLTNEILSKRISENVELVELRRAVAECSAELMEFRQEYMMLKSKTETELDAEQQKIRELSSTVESEMKKNQVLIDELASLKNATNLIESIRDETKNVQV